MLRLTVAQLAALDGREYIGEIKARLRDDEAWVILLVPALEARTRWALNRILDSIDLQKSRVGDTDPVWTRRVDGLRGFVKARLDAMVPVEAAPVSLTKDAKLWRGFSARLARELAEVDPSALEAIQMPYGGQTAAQWLAAREEKKS